MSYEYILNVCGPPGNAVCLGCQNDGAGRLWSAIAHTEHGPICGKASGDTCWYPYGGEELYTNDFSWLTGPEGCIAPMRNNGSGPPAQAISAGHQDDGNEYYAAIAITDHGLVPGKARDDNCWYPHGGVEHLTPDFLWLIFV